MMPALQSSRAAIAHGRASTVWAERRAFLAGAAALALLIAGTGRATAADCDAATKAALLAPAAAGSASIELGCSVKLTARDVVTKVVILRGSEASGATFDCSGGTINGGPGTVNAGKDMVVIQSRKTAAGWQRPENVTVRNCRIAGSVRILGLGANGEAAPVKESSRNADHTAFAQGAAPTNITLSRLIIGGSGRTPIYLSPGVTRVTLTNSDIGGSSSGPGIYLDAESGFNVIKNNSIHVDTSKREQLALDGSANNVITGNRFASLGNGGIFAYRNCGEGGTVRHQTPQNNQIVDNIFYYKKYSGPQPSVWLGSRGGDRGYCKLDQGLPFGSSADDADHADNNVVTGNRIVNRSPQDMIRVQDPALNKVSGNVQVNQ